MTYFMLAELILHLHRRFSIPVLSFRCNPISGRIEEKRRFWPELFDRPFC